MFAVVIGNGLDAHQATVAQYGNPLRHLCQLFKSMGDIHNRHATGLQPFDLHKKHFNFTGGEHGRGLIEDEHMAIADQVARNLDHLLMANAQLPDQGVRVNRLQTHLAHGLNGRFAQLLAADPAQVAGQFVQKQVFRHRQRGQQVQFLHDHAHTQLLGLRTTARGIGLAIELHVPESRHLQATHDLR